MIHTLKRTGLKTKARPGFELRLKSLLLLRMQIDAPVGIIYLLLLIT